MADLPVIDLDDSAENRNWLRIVAAQGEHEAGKLTDAQYQQRLAELRGEVPPSEGPEIVVLDPNDPEGAYKQLMAQYHKHQDEAGESNKSDDTVA
jgi:hypothetical protein